MIPNAETMAWEAGPQAVLAAFDNAMSVKVAPVTEEDKANRTLGPITVHIPDARKLRIWLGYYERWCL